MILEYAPVGLIGCLTPQANTTVEPELTVLLPPGLGFINARLVSPMPSIEERLTDYFGQLDQAAARFANAPLHAIAVACTGASYLAGRKREAETVSALEKRAGVPVVTAGRAVVAALEAIGARRIGLVSCYPPQLTEASCDYWRTHGFEIGQIAAVFGSSESFHPIYSLRASDASSALTELRAGNHDAILMLGTGMPTLRPIASLSDMSGPPVLSCMLCLAWQCARLVLDQPQNAESVIAWSRGTGWADRLRRFVDGPNDGR